MFVLLAALSACIARSVAATSRHTRVVPDLGAVVRVRGSGDCLGVFIAHGTVLTAAHCVLGVPSLGDLRVTRTTGARARVVACLLHPALATRFARCDLDDPLASGRIHDLWTDLAIVRVFDEPAAVSRPSVLESLDAPESLMGADAWVVSDDAPRWTDTPCPRLVRNRVALLEEGGVRTAGAEPADISTRPGDSGGPLLLFREGRWVVAGILSGGASSYSPDSRFAPTYLVETVAWIRGSD